MILCNTVCWLTPSIWAAPFSGRHPSAESATESRRRSSSVTRTRQGAPEWSARRDPNQPNDPNDPNDPNGSAGSNGTSSAADPTDVVQRTLRARAERKLGDHLVVVGIGAQCQEWFCLDVSKPTSAGEYPVVMFDAKDNALDQQFYEDFGQMLAEVMGFVADNLDQPLD